MWAHIYYDLHGSLSPNANLNTLNAEQMILNTHSEQHIPIRQVAQSRSVTAAVRAMAGYKARPVATPPSSWKLEEVVIRLPRRRYFELVLSVVWWVSGPTLPSGQMRCGFHIAVEHTQ